MSLPLHSALYSFIRSLLQRLGDAVGFTVAVVFCAGVLLLSVAAFAVALILGVVTSTIFGGLVELRKVICSKRS